MNPLLRRYKSLKNPPNYQTC